MSVNPTHASTWPLTPPADEPTFAQAGWYALLAVEGLVVVAVIGLLVTLAQQAPEAVRDGWRFVDGGWLMIATAGAISGGVASWLGLRAMNAAQGAVAATCVALALMAGSATLAVGVIEAVALWRYPHAMHTPYVVSIRPPAATTDPQPAAAAPPSSASEPDASRGAELFSASCAACHGGKGEGVTGIAPALAATAWLEQRSDGEVLAFLKVGRMPGDPDSTMGRAMPPRGGNMALTDNDLADIVAFMRALEAADTDVAPGAAAAAPPSWLLTQPEREPAAPLVADRLQPDWPRDIAGVTRASFDTADRTMTATCLAAINAVRLLHIIALVLVMLRWLGRMGMNRPTSSVRATRGIAVGWVALVVMNLAVLAAWAATT